MKRYLLYLILLVGASVQAAEDLCAISIQGNVPMQQIAPGIIQADIESGRAESDPLKAIQRFQNHNYYMKHPDLPVPKSISRCAPPNLYQQLSDETAKVVSSISGKYKSNRWFLSEDEFNNPGLFQLLLLSNQYDKFMLEAEAFLLSAKDDSEAPQLFNRVHKLISTRQGHLSQMQTNLNNEHYSHGFGLLDIERQGIEILSSAPVHIDKLRQAHIDFLLDKENKVFPKVKNNPPPKDSLVLINPDLAESLTYIDRALKIALEKSKPTIRSHAEMRGDELAAANRHQEAMPYFKTANAEKKLAKSEAIVESSFESKAEDLKQNSQEQIKGMMKTEKETEEFENETDNLAEELGIDLDNF